MPRALPTPQALSQADVIRYLGRKRFDHARAKGWLAPRLVLRGQRGRGFENYALADVLGAERKFLGE